MALNTKLFPPGIEGKLPAFAGSLMKIPFVLNRAVGYVNVSGITAIIKTVQNNMIIGTTFSGYTTYDESTGNYYAFIDLGNYYSSTVQNGKIYPGQYYKVQLAFNDLSGQVGYYSSVGIIKCTTMPVLTIPAAANNYYGSQEYVGVYSQAEDSQDKTEKIYSYKFDLRDGNDNLIATSGEQLHNSAMDTDTNQSVDSWSVRQNLTEGLPYYLTYTITTMNGLVASSQSYVIMQQETIDPEIPCQLMSNVDQENGCIQLYLRPYKKKTMNGSYILARASSEDNYGSWSELYKFNYKRVMMEPRSAVTPPSRWDINDMLIWEDFTVKQGVSYIYSIQAYNANGLFSTRQFNTEEILDSSYNTNPLPSGEYLTVFKTERLPLYVDFEDMFLFDGERQLKIRFNPKMSSFKSTVLETKVDTLGGKYPFIFRNGNVEYKEFPVSGLLSLISDPNEKFLKGIQNNLYATRQTGLSQDNLYLDTWLVGDNIARERKFKMEVLTWLTNGKPKLFRSPTEGNFIVRLMNSSLSPNDTLGRMLHSFNSTAYEIAECTFENLQSLGFITTPYLGDNRILKVGQIQLNKELDNYKGKFPMAYMANFTYMIPGTIVVIDFMNGQQLEIEIGGTGCYYVQLKDWPIRNIALKDPNKMYWGDGKFTYCYYDTAPTDNFSSISNLTVTDEFKQIIGRQNWVLYDSEGNVTIEDGFTHNVLNDIVDTRKSVGKFHYLKIAKRPIQTIYWDNERKVWSYNISGSDLMRDLDWNRIMIYEARTVTSPTILEDGSYYYDSEFIGYIYNCDAQNSDGSYGGKEVLDIDPPDCRFGLIKKGESYPPKNIVDFSGNPASLDSPRTLGRVESLSNLLDLEGIYLGSGVVIDMSYRLKEVEYTVESDQLAVKNAKKEWLTHKEQYETIRANSESSRSEIEVAEKVMNNSYRKFILVLDDWLEKEGVES